MKNFQQLRAMGPPISRVATAVSNIPTGATYRRVVAALLVCLVLAGHVSAVEEGFVTATFGNAAHVQYPGTLQVERELLRFDLASLPMGARVQRAILRFPFRSDWGGHTVVKLLPVGVSEQCLPTDPPAHCTLRATQAVKTWAATADIPLNQWTFVVATYDGSKVRLYINDTMEEFSETRSLSSVQANDVYLGAVYSSGRYFNGLIDDAMIFNTALSQDEVATLCDSFTLDWDENGNLVDSDAGSSSAVAYAYNWDNKLRKAELTPSDSIEIKYDLDGNRILKKTK